MSNTDEITNKIMNMAAEKIPAEKLMMVPMFLLMIDTKSWKFPPQFKSPESQEVIDFIENNEELKNIFQKKIASV